MKHLTILAAFFLVACSNRETETFDVTQCRRVAGKQERDDRRQGACMVWSKVGNSRFCSSYRHYIVRQHAETLTCSRVQWVDGRAP